MRQTRNKWMLAPGRVALALMALGLAGCSTRVVDTSGRLSPAGPASTALGVGFGAGYDLGEFFARQGWVEPSAVSRAPALALTA